MKVYTVQEQHEVKNWETLAEHQFETREEAEAYLFERYTHNTEMLSSIDYEGNIHSNFNPESYNVQLKQGYSDRRIVGYIEKKESVE